MRSPPGCAATPPLCLWLARAWQTRLVYFRRQIKMVREAIRIAEDAMRTQYYRTLESVPEVSQGTGTKQLAANGVRNPQRASAVAESMAGLLQTVREMHARVEKADVEALRKDTMRWEVLSAMNHKQLEFRDLMHVMTEEVRPCLARRTAPPRPDPTRRAPT